MRVNTNVNALVAYRNLTNANSAVSNSMEKLSTGFRINKASDDAAGLGIANKLRAENKAMTQASRNAEQATSMLQIAEGGAGTIQKMLERMKELATQAGSDNVDDAGRGRIKAEWDQLKQEITRTVDTTKFQGKKLLDGSFGASVATAGSSALASGTTFNDVKISGAKAGLYTLSNTGAGVLSLTDGTTTETAAAGADGKQTVSFSRFGVSVETTGSYDKDATAAVQNGTISVAPGSNGGDFLVSSSGDYDGQDLISLDKVDLSMGTSAGLNLNSATLTSNGTVGEWQDAIDVVDTAIGKVNTALGSIGASQNRISYAQENVKTTIVNFSAAESVIRDLDMAEEMTRFSKSNIISQAAQSMLAQANQSTQGVLQLLRG